MPTAPLWTTTDLANISAAIASGVLEVRFSDRTIRYNSIADLLKAQTVISTYLDKQAGTVKIRQTRLYTDSGWGN